MFIFEKGNIWYFNLRSKKWEYGKNPNVYNPFILVDNDWSITYMGVKIGFITRTRSRKAAMEEVDKIMGEVEKNIYYPMNS
jgi:hypothetical protein